MTAIKFSYADVPSIKLRRKKEVKEFIQRVFKLEGKRLEHITYVFCSDQYLLDLNKAFLDHDYYTDIITFDLTTTVSNGVEGEVYISVDRVHENAEIHGVRQEEEFLRVILHGALHLCGYKDKKKSEITIMRHKEDHYLLLFGNK